MAYQFPYCNFDKLRISKANGLRFIYLTTEGSFFEGECMEENELYIDQSNCGFNWAPFAQYLPCDGMVKFQFQWCDSSVPLVHLFDANGFYYEFFPVKVYSGDYDIYEQEVNFPSATDLCGSCVDFKIATKSGAEYFYHAQSEPLHLEDAECLVKVEYWNNEDYDGQYFCGGYRNTVYLQAQFTKFKNVETKKVYINSNNFQRVLSKNISKVRTLDINYIPEYLHDIVSIAFSMDNTHLDGISYTADSEYEIQENETLYSLNKGSVELYKNLYKFENSNCSDECGGITPSQPVCVLPDPDMVDLDGGNAFTGFTILNYDGGNALSLV